MRSAEADHLAPASTCHCTNTLTCAAAIDVPPAPRRTLDAHQQPQFRSTADHIIAQLTSDLASSRSENRLLKAQQAATPSQVSELQEQVERLQQRLAAVQSSAEGTGARAVRSASEAAAQQQDALAAVSPASATSESRLAVAVANCSCSCSCS